MTPDINDDTNANGRMIGTATWDEHTGEWNVTCSNCGKGQTSNNPVMVACELCNGLHETDTLEYKPDTAKQLIAEHLSRTGSDDIPSPPQPDGLPEVITCDMCGEDHPSWPDEPDVCVHCRMSEGVESVSDPDESRVCPRCEQSRPADFFRANADQPDICLRCRLRDNRREWRSARGRTPSASTTETLETMSTGMHALVISVLAGSGYYGLMTLPPIGGTAGPHHLLGLSILVLGFFLNVAIMTFVVGAVLKYLVEHTRIGENTEGELNE